MGATTWKHQHLGAQPDLALRRAEDDRARTVMGGDAADWSGKYVSSDRSTPSGRTLRRYWHPVALSTEVAAGTALPLRLLGDELVLFRLPNGELGVLPEHCPHRAASLAYGYVEEDGLRCSYHGWKFSPSGKMLDAPFGGPKDGPPTELRWCGRATEVRGIVFLRLDTSLPNEAASLSFPLWDILVNENDDVVVQRHVVDCNWFQYQENAADPTHTLYAHAVRFRALGFPESSGFYGAMTWYGFRELQFGLVKTWRYENRPVGWGNVALYPNILRLDGEMHWRVPLDQERTLIFQVSSRPRVDPTRRTAQPHGNVDGLPPVRTEEAPPLWARGERPNESYSLWSFIGQDAAVCASQGRAVNRLREHLAASDLGVGMYRQGWQEICDTTTGPEAIYAQLRRGDGILDPKPWLGDGDVAVSLPLNPALRSARLAWATIFDNGKVVSVPRGGAGPGPLG